MPLPMIVPTTIAIACRSPSARGRCACEDVVVAGLCICAFHFGSREQTHTISHSEGHNGADHHQPGVGDTISGETCKLIGAEPEIQIKSKPTSHPDDGSELRGSPREDSQQKNSQKGTIRDRDDCQADFHDSPARSEEERQPKEY